MKTPRLLYLTLTTRCNFDCVFCDERLANGQCDSDIDMIGKVAELLGPETIVDLGGCGEVLLLGERFKSIARILTAAGSPFSFSTNGFLLTPAIVDFLAGTSCYLINVSVNSLDAETHKRLTGRAVWLEVLAHVEYMQRSDHLWKTSLSMVVTKHNWNEMPEFVRYAKARDIYSMRLLPLAPMVTPRESCLDPVNDLCFRKVHQQTVALAKELGQTIQIFSLNEKAVGYSPKCSAPFESMKINLDGTVHACCWSYRSMGNIKDQSWREIWEGERYEDFRESIRNGSMRYCQQCREFA